MAHDQRIVRQLHTALQDRNPHDFQLALLRFGDNDAGEREAFRFLQEDADPDVRAWWLEEACDLPHDPAAEMRQVLAVTSDFLAEQGQEGVDAQAEPEPPMFGPEPGPFPHKYGDQTI